MTQTDQEQMRALQLRTQALALLQEAQAIDGLKPFTVTHSHNYGASTYIGWAKKLPNDETAAMLLDSEFEPERDETLMIEDNVTLEEFTGVSVSSRLDDIVAASDAGKGSKPKI